MYCNIRLSDAQRVILPQDGSDGSDGGGSVMTDPCRPGGEIFC
jgi:hypothetical protein